MVRLRLVLLKGYGHSLTPEGDIPVGSDVVPPGVSGPNGQPDVEPRPARYSRPLPAKAEVANRDPELGVIAVDQGPFVKVRAADAVVLEGLLIGKADLAPRSLALHEVEGRFQYAIVGRRMVVGDLQAGGEG